jgi:hypothetical protein
LAPYNMAHELSLPRLRQTSQLLEEEASSYQYHCHLYVI